MTAEAENSLSMSSSIETNATPGLTTGGGPSPGTPDTAFPIAGGSKSGPSTTDDTVGPAVSQADGGVASAGRTDGKSVPPTSQGPKDDLTARASAIFGDNLVKIGLEDKRIPLLVRQAFQGLEIADPGEFLSVPCGAPSDLCAVGLLLEEKSSYKEFRNNNPLLHKTVTTSWGELVFMWLRITGWRPANCHVPGAIWISSGLMPTIVERVTADSRWFQNTGNDIVTVQFADLNWSPEAAEVFQQLRIQDKHGSFVRQIGPRRRALNYTAVAHYLAELMSLAYDRNHDRFTFQRLGQSKQERLLPHDLNQAASIFLQHLAARNPDHFPPGDHLKPIVALLKRFCAVERPGETDGLQLYLNDRLEHRDGSDLTTGEIYDRYVEFCKATGVAMIPKFIFLDKLGTAVRTQFGMAKSHCVMRPHADGRLTARCGFKSLGFKSSGA